MNDLLHVVWSAMFYIVPVVIFFIGVFIMKQGE